MHCVRKVTDDLYWIGGNDHRLALFENVHPIPEGVSYNSYLLLDEKTVLFDTADWDVCRQFLENLEYVLDGRPLDYIIVNHMEPDHAASLAEVTLRHPEAVLISTAKAFTMMGQFGFAMENKRETVKEKDTRCFGKHTVTFIMAPMVHWPEVMFTFDTTDGILFSADAFGTFGALDGRLFNDEVDFERDWLVPARRYYTNIVGKYGRQVQAVLKKAGGLDIRMICPLHGPVWRTDLGWFIDKHVKWATCTPEEKGVVIVYGSMYGNTEAAAQKLAALLCEKGMTNVRVYDVSETHVSYLIAEAFRFSHLVLASVTYNLGIFPPMKDFIHDMQALEFKGRTVGLVENGTWAIKSGALMKEELEKMKDMTILDGPVTVTSSVNDASAAGLEALAESLIASMGD